jgi:ABC-type protease/lipase transport system fused ATPase/permease subunit
LQLCASLYSLAVYDRALPSGDFVALALLTAAALSLHAASCLLDFRRGRMLSRAGLRLSRCLERRVLDLFAGDRRRALFALGDVERIAHYLTSPGPPALLDAVWIPASLAVLALLHPALAMFACLGICILVLFAATAEAHWRFASGGMAEARLQRYQLGTSGLCAGERRWRDRAVSRAYYRRCASALGLTLTAGATVKAVRASLQSLGFGLGALLVIHGSLSLGELFASSLIASRLFASLDAALAYWRGFAAARDSYARLAAMGVADKIEIMAGPRAVAQILNSSMLAKAARSASDQAPESFLK